MDERLKAVETIVEIPIELIRENPDNPRGPVSLEDGRTMAESLEAVGQCKPVLVRPQSEAEKAQFPPTEYLMLGGHRRLAGAKLAGWKTLKATIVTPKTPHEELLEVVLDNRHKPIGWWKEDLAIERFLKPTNGDGQRKLAAELDISPSNVNKAWKLTQALNPVSRGLVTQNLASQPPDETESVSSGNTKSKVIPITRSILLVLADLRDPQEVEKALRRVLDDQMNEPQARQLVAGLKGGTDPAAQPKKAHRAVVAGDSVKAPAMAQAGSSSYANSHSELAQPRQGPQPVASAQVPTNPAGTATGLKGWLGDLLPQHQQAKSLVVGGMAGWVGGFLAANFKRAMGTITRRWMLHGMLGLGVAGFLVTHGFSSRSKPAPQSGPQAGGQAQVVPSQSAVGSQGTLMGSVVNVPPEWQGRVVSGQNLATQLAMDFYGFGYYDNTTWLNSMNGDLSSAYSPVFFQTFFPPSKMEAIQNLKLKGFFNFNQPIQLLAIDAQNETFWVGGGAKIKSDHSQVDQLVAQGDVALEVHLAQTPGGKNQVVLVKELTALPFDFAQGGPNQSSSHDSKAGGQVGDGAKAAQKTQKVASSETSSSKVPSAPASQKTDPAAKFVGDAAGEAAKKFLGF